MSTQELVLRFLSTQPMASISTIDYKTGRPEAALIAFAELEALEIIFETFYDTRKYKNLKHNSAVALVIGWEPDNHITLQYEGNAQEIPAKQVPKYRSILLQKDTPCTEKFLLHSKVRLFKARPTWLRYSGYTGKSPKITELNFSENTSRPAYN